MNYLKQVWKHYSLFQFSKSHFNNRTKPLSVTLKNATPKVDVISGYIREDYDAQLSSKLNVKQKKKH